MLLNNVNFIFSTYLYKTYKHVTKKFSLTIFFVNPILTFQS